MLDESLKRFNRTFMELKRACDSEVERHDCPGFNRTFMELKHIKAAEQEEKGRRFNRTFMELKHPYVLLATVILSAF